MAPTGNKSTKKMKTLLQIAVFLFGVFAKAQTALHHAGSMQIHDAKIGFHTNFINNAPFDQNLGLVGFYGSNFLNIKGSVSPVFYNFEIRAVNGVTLNVSTIASNIVKFTDGDIVTQKSLRDIYFALLGDAMYNEESDFSKVDGYALISNQQTYSFPVGDGTQLRPLIINSNSVNLTAKGAYFLEDPNAPFSFSQIFDTNETARQLDGVNTREFWRLESSVPSTVTLSWNPRSDIVALTEKTENLLVVGWSKLNKKWEILGNTAVSGDALDGTISSETFIPDDYEIITIGSLLVPQDRIKIDNFYFSPNGDGINDVLIIEELELSPNNLIKIYNRNKLLVFQKENYTNEFAGFSNVDNLVVKRSMGLPEGMYFYVVNLFDLGFEFQGFIYLSR
jgi:gliding motility-associated-like protein